MIQKITLRVNDPRVSVLENGNSIESQILPVMNFKEGQFCDSVFELVFFIELMSFQAKTIRLEWNLEQPKTTIPSIVFASKTLNS